MRQRITGEHTLDSVDAFSVAVLSDADAEDAAGVDARSNCRGDGEKSARRTRGLCHRS